MEQPKKLDSENTGTEKTKKSDTSSHQFSAGLALILSLSSLMLGGYLWYFFQGPGNTLEGDFIGVVEQVNQLDQTLSERLVNLEARVADNQESGKVIEQSIDKLRINLGRDQTNWAISEAEHLLIIANNRLQLARDIDTAIAALQGADYQLRLLAQPKFLVVRKTIANEISILAALDKIDIPGMAIRLSTIANKVNILPISTETAGKPKIKEVAPEAETQVPPQTTKQQTFFGEIWQDLLSLIRIRNNVEQYKPLLSAEQSYFVRENLRLRLYGCQQALLASNDVVYQQNLADSLQWLKQNFDTDSQSVIAAISELEKLATIEIELSLPDISGSLEKIRQLRNKTQPVTNSNDDIKKEDS